MQRYHFPLDPECPAVAAFYESLNDPIMEMSGCAGEFTEEFERKHIAHCDRCREYGCANVDVEEG